MRAFATVALLAMVAFAQEAAKEAEAPKAVDYSALNKAQEDAASLRAANAFKFQQTRVEAAAKATTEAATAEAAAAATAAKGGKAQTFKVEPAAEAGTEVKPAPGQNDAPVKVRNADDYMESVTSTTEYLGSATFESNIKSLLEEVDQSENKVKGLKLRLVEKENFVDSLAKREEMLQGDVSKDKEAVENLHAHVKALKARVERIKKEKQLRLLEAQFHEYSSAAKRIGDQASELTRIKALIYSKMKGLVGEIKPLRKQEDTSMAKSIDVKGGEEAAAEEDINSPAAVETAETEGAEAAAEEAAAAPAADAAAAATTEEPAAEEAAAAPAADAAAAATEEPVAEEAAAAPAADAATEEPAAEEAAAAPAEA